MAAKAGKSGDIVASIIVPAYKEGANLEELVSRVFAAFAASKGSIKKDQVVRNGRGSRDPRAGGASRTDPW